MDFICESSKAKRNAGLKSLINYLLLNTNSDCLENFEITLNNSLFNCMRKGKTEERCLAATAVGTTHARIIVCFRLSLDPAMNDCQHILDCSFVGVPVR